MKKTVLMSCLLGMLAIAPGVKAEDLNDLSNLLATRQCQSCDLTAAGLVNAKLGRANLSGSDLRQANLSGADLSLANLSGADLTGASLAGANLAGANLEGAILDAADLRGAYLSGVNFKNTSLETYYIQGTVGLLNAGVSAEKFYQWGFIEAESNNHRGAIAYYDAAIAADPQNGAILLSRAIARYRLKDYTIAQQDATAARVLFEKQGFTVGVEASDRLLAEVELALNPKSSSDNSFGSTLAGISMMLLRLFF
jgi:uncharacterized protein YjbI with pentapeptide repeats